MFKGFQDTSSLQQFQNFPNLNMQQAASAYGFSGVNFWLDAGYGVNTRTNLSRVSRWDARIGGASFIQSTLASQPIFILNDINYNNYPSIQNSGLNGMDTAAGTGLKLNGQSITIAIVSKTNNFTTSTTNPIISVTPGRPALYISDGRPSQGTFLYGFGLISANNHLAQTQSTRPRIKIITTNSIIINGSVSASINISNENNEELVRLFQLSGFYYNGSLAEMIVFNYAMDSTEAIMLSDRLNQKYCIY